MNRTASKLLASCAAVVVIAASGAVVLAQNPPPQSATPPAAQGKLTPLKVQLVVSRMQGEKKISSLPYLLWVTANDRQATSLRMGVEVPVYSTALSGGAAVPSYNYRPVGTNIDCVATTVEGGFNLNITLADSSVQFEGKEGVAPPAGRPPDVPSFRSFSSKFSILLRDGQTAQYTAATDPVNGETLKVDVTLTVLK